MGLYFEMYKEWNSITVIMQTLSGNLWLFECTKFIKIK